MCFSLLDSAVAACGLATRIRFCPASAAAQVLQTAVPYGKIVLVSEDGESFAFAERLRAKLGEFRPVSVVLGGEDKFEGLFSLADDVRAALAAAGLEIVHAAHEGEWCGLTARLGAR